MKLLSKAVWFGLAASLATASAVAMDIGTDDRVKLVLKPDERHLVLFEMRSFLNVLQIISDASTRGDMQAVAEAARTMGSGAANLIPPLTVAKLPETFQMLAGTVHNVPWIFNAKLPELNDDVWELYDGAKDWTQAHDLAKEMPAKLAELHMMFAIEAVKYNVFPLDDRLVERFDPLATGAPTIASHDSQLLFPGMGRLSEWNVLPLKNVSFSVTAEVDVPDRPADGVIVAQGGRFGGWSLYAKDGKAMFTYNWFGLERYRTQAQQPIPAGEHQVRAEFAYDGGGLGKGGTLTLYCDGREVGHGRIEHTQPVAFSAEEAVDIGCETGSRVTDDFPARNGQFNGRIHWVQLDVGKDNQSHLIKPEDRLRVVMARQ